MREKHKLFVILFSVLVVIAVGLELQQTAQARRAYGSYDLDEDSRQAILHGGSSSSHPKHGVMTRRSRVHRSNTSTIQPSSNNQNNSATNNSVSPQINSNSSSGNGGGSGSNGGPAVNENRAPATFDEQPGGLSPLAPIDPPTSYTRP